MGLVFAAEADEGETLPVLDVPNLFRAHVGKPLFAIFRKVIHEIIFTRGDDYMSFCYMFVGKCIECCRGLIRVKNLRELDEAVAGIYDHDVQPSIVAVLVRFYCD